MSKRGKAAGRLTPGQAASMATMATTVLMADAASQVLREVYAWSETQVGEFVTLTIIRAGEKGGEMGEEARRLAAEGVA